MTLNDQAKQIAGGLSKLETDLLLDRCSEWGAWMWECGSGMVAKGLATKRNGSIQFDTPLADQVRRILTEEERHG